MRYLLRTRTIFLLLVVTTLSSCNFFDEYFTARNKTLEFVNALLAEDFKKCAELMPWALYPESPKDTLEMRMRVFKKKLDERMGLNLKATFLSSLTDKNSAVEPPEIHKLGVVQLANDTCYAKFEVRFDNKTGQVDNIELVSIDTVPQKANLYVFGFFSLVALSINVFAIWKVMKSSFKRKWLWIIGIMLLNYPALVFTITKGPMLSWNNVPFLGLDFTYRDIDELGTVVGLPIGALLVFYKIYFKKTEVEQAIES